MRKINITFDLTEVVKLISVCNAAIVSEEEILRNMSYNPVLMEHTKGSIEKIWEIKAKLKTAMMEGSTL